MRNTLKFEFHRLFTSKGFYLALAIGAALSIWMTVQSIVDLHIQMDLLASNRADDSAYFYPLSLYNCFIGIDYAQLPSIIFFTIFPLLTCIPYAYTYLQDKQSGYVRNILSRTKKMHYFLSKYLVTFASAALVVGFTFLFNYMTTALFIPSLLPETAAFTFPVADSCILWSSMYRETPFLYILLYSIVDALFIGAFTTIALTFSSFVKNKYVVMIAPFLFFLVFDYAMGMIGQIPWRPQIFLRQFQPVPLQWPAVLIESLVFLLLSLVSFLGFEAKRDVY